MRKLQESIHSRSVYIHVIVPTEVGYRVKRTLKTGDHLRIYYNLCLPSLRMEVLQESMHSNSADINGIVPTELVPVKGNQ